MSVESIILGLLREPSTGYQIKQDFDHVFSNFWRAEQSQIYRTLRDLERRGLVTSRHEASDKGPPRRVYRRTDAGRGALEEWLTGDVEIGAVRIPYLAQLFFLDQLRDPAQTEHVLRAVRSHYAARLERLEAIDEEWTGGAVDYEYESDEDLHAHLVLTHGLARCRALRDWADSALALTRKRATGAARARTRAS